MILITLLRRAEEIGEGRGGQRGEVDCLAAFQLSSQHWRLLKLM